MDQDWLVKLVIAGVLVVGALFILLFAAMMLRESEENALRARAQPLKFDNSDPRRRASGQDRAATPAPRRASAPEDRSRRGDGVIISGFDTGGSRLLVQVGGAALKRRKAGVCFGRDPSISEFTIPDDGGALSRRHFRIRLREPGKFEIEDLGSIAGTKLDGAALKPFESKTLNLPAKLEVGRTILDVRGGGEGDVANDVKTILIGRHSDCEVSLADDSVSRFHAELVLGRNKRLFLVDRQSTRGTFVQRGAWQRLDRADYVQEDQRVRFGDFEISVGDLARRAERA